MKRHGLYGKAPVERLKGENEKKFAGKSGKVAGYRENVSEEMCQMENKVNCL